MIYISRIIVWEKSAFGIVTQRSITRHPSPFLIGSVAIRVMLPLVCPSFHRPPFQTYPKIYFSPTQRKFSVINPLTALSCFLRLQHSAISTCKKMLFAKPGFKVRHSPPLGRSRESPFVFVEISNRSGKIHLSAKSRRDGGIPLTSARASCR
jgi:hypothetical protein